MLATAAIVSTMTRQYCNIYQWDGVMAAYMKGVFFFCQFPVIVRENAKVTTCNQKITALHRISN